MSSFTSSYRYIYLYWSTYNSTNWIWGRVQVACPWCFITWIEFEGSSWRDCYNMAYMQVWSTDFHTIFNLWVILSVPIGKPRSKFGTKFLQSKTPYVYCPAYFMFVRYSINTYYLSEWKQTPHKVVFGQKQKVRKSLQLLFDAFYSELFAYKIISARSSAHMKIEI